MYGFIYETTNNVNGMKYIGQKIYDDNGLWKNYLGSGIYLKRAINKYGRDNFSKKIIEECDSKDELDSREIYWINYFDAVSSPDYYNIASGGDGGNTIAGFDEDRLNQLKLLHSERLKECYKKGTRSRNTKLSVDDILIIIQRLKNNEFDSDIAKDFNVSPRTINDVRHHRTWKEFTDGIVFDDISHRSRGRTSRKITQYSIDGKKLNTFESSGMASHFTGIDSNLILDVCSGNKKTSHGFVWRYEGDAFEKFDSKNNSEIEIDQYSKDGKYIRSYKSIMEASRHVGIHASNIGAVLNGMAKSAGGYFWCKSTEKFEIPTYKIKQTNMK